MSAITLKNTDTGEIFEVDDGFSWTTLFFGIGVPLFRKDYSSFVFGLVLWIINIGVFGVGLGIILALPFRFISACLYNSWYIAKLTGKHEIVENENFKDKYKKRELSDEARKAFKETWGKRMEERRRKRNSSF